MTFKQLQLLLGALLLSLILASSGVGGLQKYVALGYGQPCCPPTAGYNLLSVGIVLSVLEG